MTALLACCHWTTRPDCRSQQAFEARSAPWPAPPSELASGPAPLSKKESKLLARLKRPLIKVGSIYYDVVERVVNAGLQRWEPRRRMHHHRGFPVLVGIFAVGKRDSGEKRMISAAVPANMSLDMQRVPRLRFPNMTQVATVREVPRSARLVVSKRDVRHFGHKV